MANLQKLIDLDGLSYFLGQIKTKFVRSVNGVKPDFKGNVNIANMEGATSNAAGKAGLVPIPAAGKQDMALCGDATFKVLPITGGGTGLTSPPSMLTNLGSTSAANVLQASPRPGVTGILPVANGGTGANTVAAAVKALLGSSAIGSSTKPLYYDGATLKACADSIGGGGIVAQLLEQNGYVKFANGLILQWGYKATAVGTTTTNLVISYSLSNFGCFMRDYGSVRQSSQHNVTTSVTLNDFTSAFSGANDGGFYWFSLGI